MRAWQLERVHALGIYGQMVRLRPDSPKDVFSHFVSKSRSLFKEDSRFVDLIMLDPEILKGLIGDYVVYMRRFMKRQTRFSWKVWYWQCTNARCSKRTVDSST